MIVKSPEELRLLKEGGGILAGILSEAAALARPGVTAGALNALTEKRIREAGGEPSFKNYRAKGGPKYPASLCISLNSVVVHGVPSKGTVLKNGDIVGLDLGVKWKGLFLDAAVTVGIGRISPQDRKLINTAREALAAAVKEARFDGTIGDIGFATQNFVESHGFNVVRQLVGHGVGKAVHEEPQIPNFGSRGAGEKLKIGQVLAIEPMVTAGDWHLELAPDGFGYRTVDGSQAAHFEHTIVVTKNKPLILTKYSL